MFVSKLKYNRYNTYRFGHHGYKQMWQWQIAAQKEVLDILNQITNFLIIKQEKAEKAIKEITQKIADNNSNK